MVLSFSAAFFAEERNTTCTVNHQSNFQARFKAILDYLSEDLGSYRLFLAREG